ncbi:unnamed protein product [Bathycoccus prasinos]
MLSRASYAASKKNCFSDVLQESYNEEYCNKHWDCTAEELLRPWKKGVNRTVFSDSKSKIKALSNSEYTGQYGVVVTSVRLGKDSIRGEKFAYELLKHKYAINMPGAGNWSRRMSVLLQSGSLVFQAESPGYQFYEFGLSPGSHFIPFDPEIGKLGAGNLIPRVEWATRHDDTAKKIAFRGFSFVQYCLNEGSIDYFTRTLLRKYSALLNGILSNVSLVDLSECSCYRAKKPCRISRLCKGIIDKCWE